MRSGKKRHFPHADRRCAFFHTSLDVDNPQSSPSNTPRLLQCQCKEGVGVIGGITEWLGQDVDLGPFMSYQISRTYLLTMTFHIFYYCLNMKGQPKGRKTKSCIINAQIALKPIFHFPSNCIPWLHLDYLLFFFLMDTLVVFRIKDYQWKWRGTEHISFVKLQD